MTTKKMCGDTIEMREVAARICRDYLNGAWKNVNAQNIGFKHISGGLSNWLYHIWLPEDLINKSAVQTSPKQVLVRMYGQMHGERALESLLTESVIFTLLSERGLGPRLHGIFPGGRIEQYINARPLRTSELSQPTLSAQIAQKMAAIHKMEVPLNKEPKWLWDTMDRWLVTTSTKLPRGKVPGHGEFIKSMDFAGELDYMKQLFRKNPSPVVFCHNDLQEGNILIKDPPKENNNGEPKLVLIDFEYCSYNYRGFDMANHLLEWMYDYTEPAHPYYREIPDGYPTDAQKMHFVKTYLQNSGSTQSPLALFDEIKTYSLASHLFWGLWAIINADSSEITFGYWEYAISRLNAYLRLKEEINDRSNAKRKLDDFV